MTCVVLGAGLVGSFLGAAAGAAWGWRRGGLAPCERVVLPIGEVLWRPQGPAALSAVEAASVPWLVACRAHRTPWEEATEHWLAAQNGLGQPCPVAVCFCAIDRDPEGRIVSSTSSPPRVVVGPLAPLWADTIAAWRHSGIVVDEVADVRPAQWEKAILNATLGPLCFASGRAMQDLWTDPPWRDLICTATAEGLTVAEATGISIAPEAMDRAAAFFDSMGNHQPSVCADAGELPWILDPLLCAADRAGLAVPALARIDAMVAALGQGAP